MLVDLFLVYSFIKRLATPFNKWDAYKLGIIDENGNQLKPRSELRTVDERKAWGKFDVMISKLKKLLEKVPGGKTRIASYAAALWLIKEGEERNENLLTEENLENELNDYINFVENNLQEEVATNSAGGGGVAGIGVGPDGEPGLTKKQQEKHKKKNQMLKRFKDTIKVE